MNESILKALMRLFAIIASFEKEGVSGSGREIVQSYLKQQLNQELVDEYLALYDQYLQEQAGRKGKKRLSASSVKVLAICEQINEELRQEQKMLVLLKLFEFINYDNVISEVELEFVKTVADVFNISNQEYENCKGLILESPEKIPQRENVLKINNKKEEPTDNSLHIYDENLDGELIILRIESTNMYAFGYTGNDALTLNSQVISPKMVYILTKGSAIRSHKMRTIYYSDVVSRFLQDSVTSKVIFTADHIEFKFKNSDNGLQEFTFSEESGQLIGVMGGSGAGKSTLLNIFNGSIPPNKGKITINGIDLYKEKEKLEGVIGFIPQDDLLIEELTVWENLYFNAKLCFDNYSKQQLEEAVTKVLKDLDLYEIRDLKVGGPLNKFISGGQRKRLNIALELIREPVVMFVDEPTSGLSSMDSEMVMDLLKEITLKGKLVITNIHQPSSDIYKLFDKLLILDKGGHPVYYGNPIEAVVYFKKMANYVNADESECPTCGNVNPEQVLQILESKVVDEYGRLTRNRKTSPKEWYQLYRENIDKKIEIKDDYTELPPNDFKIPNKIKQFIIYTIRDVKSKLTNKQYMLISLLEAPALAFVLGYFTKFIAGTQEDPNAYVFSENENIVGYLFMCVVVALFIGMSVSAEEIIKDRKILKRESFLNLSKFSYLNSKVLIMFTLSAIQMITFVIVGNTILEIKGMTWQYFLVLFTTACFANLVGLNISSALNSVVTIYILIPFILVPQLLLSGTIVKFDKLHKSIVSHKYVSVLGDLMTSRWAYEALAVYQFKNNEFNKHFYDVRKKKSHTQYIGTFLIANLEDKLNTAFKNIQENKKDKAEETERYLRIIRNELKKLTKEPNVKEFEYINMLIPGKLDEKLYKETQKYFRDIKKKFTKLNTEARKEEDKIVNQLMKELGEKDTSMSPRDAFIKLSNDYHNKNLEDMVVRRLEIDYIRETEDELIQIKDPIYKNPDHKYGRAHFYAPEKYFFGITFDTYWFNIIVIWLTSLFMYILLITDGLRKMIEFGDRIKFKKE
ncbi:MAG: ATP-binding cassette domain-containing protein [Marinilabiliales bacterium]